MNKHDLDQTLPRITPGEVWHEKAMEHPIRDSLQVVIFSLMGCCVVFAALMVNTIISPVTVEKAEAVTFMADISEPEFTPPPLEPEPEKEEASVESEPQYVQAQPQGGYSGSGAYDGNSFKSQGVMYDENGRMYTWYSQNVLPGGGLTELNYNGRHVGDDGIVRDGDGYIAVATPNGEPIGTVVQTPLGDAKVYDYNPGGGAYDVYTGF